MNNFVTRRSNTVILPVLLASTMLTGISAAYAQESGQIETVIVTAEKRSEDMQKVPISIQALSTQKLQDLHLESFDDYIKYLPSVEFTSGGAPGFDSISMRGVNSGGDGNHTGPLPTVGLYLDEQPITTIAGALDIPSYDLARVEALSGPQGTLYGASSESGTIRMITNKPDTSGFAASYMVEANAVDHGGIGYNFDGMVNVPISDKVALRVVAWDQRNAGYIDNVFGERSFSTGIDENNANFVKKNFNTDTKYGLRAALEYDLNADWTITPFIMAQKEDTNGTFSYDPAVGYLKVESYGPNYTHDSWYQGALTVTGKIGNLDLVYSGGHMDRHVSSQEDYNDYTYWYDQAYGSAAGALDSSGNYINPSQHIIGRDHFIKDSHELRLSTDKDERLRATVGAFYERQVHYILQDYKIYGLATYVPSADEPQTNPGLSVPGWPGTIWLTDQTRIDRDIALFGEMAYDILPNLTFSAGIRYFDTSNAVHGFYGFSDNVSSHTGVAKCFTPVKTDGSIPCYDLRKQVGAEGETHKLNLTWQIDDDRMIYATYSTGFRPGGVNRAPVPTANQDPVPDYSPDTLVNLEFGWKTSWFDDHLRWNGAVYREKWKDFQFSFLGPNALTIVANAGAAAVTGVESDVTWIPLDGLTLSGAGAYNDARLTQPYCGILTAGKPVTDCADPISPKYTQLPVTPLWKLNATARYEWSIDDFMAHLQASMVHQSASWNDVRTNITGDPTDNAQTRSLLGQNRAYTEFNFTAGINRDNWQAELYINNAFDNHSQLEHTTQCPICTGNQNLIVPSQPRTIGLTFSQKFD